MILMSQIEEYFLKNLQKILQTENMVFINGEYCQADTFIILSIQNEKIKQRAFRTKILYSLLRLYNLVTIDTYKSSKYEDLKLKYIVDIPICTPLSSELIKLFSENQILMVNNVVVDRLSVNKSKLFILMENPFPIQIDQINFLFSMFIKLFNY